MKKMIQLTRLLFASLLLLSFKGMHGQCSVTASYVYSVHPNGNGMVSFTGTATGTTGTSAFFWDFGNGSIPGDQVVHTFTANGTHPVLLTVYSNSPNPVCSGTIVQNIAVNTVSCNVNTSYTCQPTGGGTYAFGKIGIEGNTTYNWNFGDGTTGTGSNVSHTYSNAGIYTVSLEVVSGTYSCSLVSAQQITVNSIPCVPNASFTAVSTPTPQVWDMIPDYPWNVTSSAWDWGDGSPLTYSMYPTHTYSAAGTYTICQSVTVSCGGNTTYCLPQYINRSTENNSMITVRVVPPAITKVNELEKETIRSVIYPNPSTGKFIIEAAGLDAGNVNITLSDITGKQVFFIQKETSNGELSREIDPGKIAEGIYFLKIQSGQRVAMQKLVISQ